MHKSSTSITRGKSCAKEVARVAKESAWVFSLLRICDKSKNSNFVCIRLSLQEVQQTRLLGRQGLGLL